MRHKDNGAPMVTQDVFQHLLFSLCIQSTRRLIQQHDVTWTKQGTGNGNTLSLTLTEPPTLFREKGIKTIRKLLYKIGTSHLQRLKHLLVCGQRIPQLQVLAQRTTKQRVTLRHIDKVATMKGTK